MFELIEPRFGLARFRPKALSELWGSLRSEGRGFKVPIMKPCPNHPEKGIIDLAEGCPECIADRQAAEADVNSPANIAKRIQEAEERAVAQVPTEDEKVTPPVSIVKVQYSMTKNAGTVDEYIQFGGRAYTYFTAEPLDVGDVVKVPVTNHEIKGKVVEINVPESEIEDLGLHVVILDGDFDDVPDVQGLGREIGICAPFEGDVFMFGSRVLRH